MDSNTRYALASNILGRARLIVETADDPRAAFSTQAFADSGLNLVELDHHIEDVATALARRRLIRNDGLFEDDGTEVICDTCGDHSNSEPGLRCGRVEDPAEAGPGALTEPCQGTYLVPEPFTVVGVDEGDTFAIAGVFEGHIGAVDEQASLGEPARFADHVLATSPEQAEEFTKTQRRRA